MFGGPERSDGIDKYVIEYGVAIDAYVLEVSERHDLIDDSFWCTIKDDYESGIHDGGGSASPCSTVAASRRWGDGGPPSLRGEFVLEMFGLKQMDRENKEECPKGTCIAMRCMEMTDWMISNQRSTWYETLRQKAGHPSVF